MNKKVDNKFETFIIGNKIDLVVLNEKIVKETNWFRWFNDEETTYHMQKHHYPNTINKQINYLKSNIDKDTTIQLGVVHKKSLTFCGVISLSNINFFNKNAEISLIIGEKEFRYLELASEVMELIINHAFLTLNLHKVCVGYFKSLENWGIFLKNTFGFVDEGVQRQHAFKNGKYTDIINLGLIKNEYLKKDLK